MKTIKDIISQFGFITAPQMAELAEHFPHTKVVIQWGYLPRERIPAFEVASKIEQVEAANQDYCRQCFISAKELSLLKQVFAIAD